MSTSYPKTNLVRLTPLRNVVGVLSVCLLPTRRVRVLRTLVSPAPRSTHLPTKALQILISSLSIVSVLLRPYLRCPGRHVSCSHVWCLAETRHLNVDGAPSHDDWVYEPWVSRRRHGVYLGPLRGHGPTLCDFKGAYVGGLFSFLLTHVKTGFVETFNKW